MTPASKQWWDLKAQYFDTVLLFKTGKFYEMFHMDADVGVQVLGFNYMKGHVGHAGFPEIGYGSFCQKLVERGYKVARVEQTETPDMLKERKSKTKGKKPQVVNREVCSVMSIGTRTFCYLDDTSRLKKSTESHGPLLTIKETLLSTPISDEEDGDQPICEYGISIVDAVNGTVTLGQFADDVLRSRMHTLLTTHMPSEVLVEGGSASSVLLSLLKSYSNFRVEIVRPKEHLPKSTAVDPSIRQQLDRPNNPAQPWDVQETIQELHRRGYFPRGSKSSSNSRARWPKVLQAAIDGNANLAVSSLGAALFYLQRSLIDEEIMTMGNIKAYVPPTTINPTNHGVPIISQLAQEEMREEDGVVLSESSTSEKEEDASFQWKIESTMKDMCQETEIDHMALDGTTLQNLEILTNGQTQSTAGSLWSKLNHTKTPHGGRLLKAWLLRPLFRAQDIARRADAVQELSAGGAGMSMGDARILLSKCGDIERLLSRVHSMSGTENASHHPNERAVLYENVVHTKRKVGDFRKLLNGLRQASEIPEVFEKIQIESGLLQRVVRKADKGGCFPDMGVELDWFFDNFDCDLAAKGEFEPTRGIDEAYDEACDTVERIEGELQEYKDEMCRHLPSSARSHWKYINTKSDSKDKYLIELPAKLQVPDDFYVKAKRGSGAKQVNKYRTPVVERLVHTLENALELQKAGKERGMQLIFSKFDSKRNIWAAAAQATALLDALGALAQVAGTAGYTRPHISECTSGPTINVVQGRHPCVEVTHSGGDFIPNDLSLGDSSSESSSNSRVLLLSGPNMGGKSHEYFCSFHFLHKNLPFQDFQWNHHSLHHSYNHQTSLKIHHLLLLFH